MSSEWVDGTLGDILTLQRGMDLPIQDRKSGKVPIVASNGIAGYHNQAPVKAPGVVIGRSGSIGGGQYIECDFWPLNTTLWVKDFKGNDPRFCYYLLRSIDFTGLNAGSGVPTLNRNHLHPMQMKRPPVAVQKQISSMLGALDDRIALLRASNATLEAIAQALFKSWFVDFDPVRAKQEGRAPEGMSDATAALFSDSFEESAVGLVPKGWTIESLGDVFDYKEGPGIRNWQYTNSNIGIKFINIRCIQDGDLSLDTANRITDEEANGKYTHFHLQPWDVVVSTSGTLGRSAIVRKEHLPLMLNTSVIRFRPIESRVGFCFVYEYLNAPEFLYKLESMASGSVQKNFGPMHLRQIKLICPSCEVVKQYEAISQPIFDKLIENRAQMQTLTNLRDILLPRLISGQLRLSEVEELVNA